MTVSPGSSVGARLTSPDEPGPDLIEPARLGLARIDEVVQDE